MDLYAENVLDRYKNPLHKADMSGGTGTEGQEGGQAHSAPLRVWRQRERDEVAEGEGATDKKRLLIVDEANPLCGDKVRISLVVGEDGKIVEALFDGQGCAISQAASDMLMERITGMKLEEAQKITNEEVYDMLGVPLSPARVKCALLAMVGVRNTKKLL